RCRRRGGPSNPSPDRHNERKVTTAIQESDWLGARFPEAGSWPLQTARNPNVRWASHFYLSPRRVPPYRGMLRSADFSFSSSYPHDSSTDNRGLEILPA